MSGGSGQYSMNKGLVGASFFFFFFLVREERTQVAVLNY